MPHTQSRYQQDLGFTDGRIRASVGDIVFTGATLAISRVAAGQWGVALGTPAAQANTFAINVTQALLRRIGFIEDLQEQFGGGGIAASAQVQNYRPDQIGSMNTGQQLQPRTALKIKGFKLNSFDVIYSIGVANATTHTCRVDQCLFKNNVAPAITSVLASGANGLQTASAGDATGPYVTNVPITTPVYSNFVDGDLWIEDVITGAEQHSYVLRLRSVNGV